MRSNFAAARDGIAMAVASKTELQRFDIGLEDLQTFLAVAELGSFSQAALKLNLSQPSISNRVRRLEEKLLVRLLDRTTRRVELTPPGRRLYREAHSVLVGLHDLLREFSQDAATRERQVRVAATLMVATIGLPPILRQFHDANPTISVSLHDLSPSQAVEQVIAGQCDMSVMALSEPRPNITFEPLGTDLCVVVTPLGHPLLKYDAAPFAEVLKYAVLSPNGHVALRRAIETAADERGLDLRLVPEALGVGNVYTLLAMAAAGLGICIHPRSFVPSELEPTLGVVPISDCDILRTFGIVTADGRELGPAARRFREFVRQSVKRSDRTWAVRANHP